MIHPTLDEFRTLACTGALVPVYKEILADLETPVSAYMKIAKGYEYSFLLESVEQADQLGRYSFMGANPSMVFKSKGRKISMRRDGRDAPAYESDDPLGELGRVMEAFKPVELEGLP
ncbi:MAG: anthranilate synthase component I, partial [Nitrospiraceae bacterium]|nr:anthranilate synthase component I [Nitrospiraceae bacterium]